MKNSSTNKINNLHLAAQFSLFVSSYLPLFLLLIGRQLVEHRQFMVLKPLNSGTVMLFFEKFGLSCLIGTISIAGFIGLILTLKNVQKASQNGNPVVVRDVKHKGSETAGYVTSYLLPFLFTSFDGWFENVAVFVVFLIIYRLYINSTLLLVNPLLGIWYGLYEVEYEYGTVRKSGLVISRDKYLVDDSPIKLYEMGHKLFFAIQNPQK